MALGPSRAKLAACSVIGAALCAGSAEAADDVVQLAPDTFMISRISYAGIFANPSKLKLGVIRDANAFAAARGKALVFVSAKETPVGGPGQWPRFEYIFRLVEAQKDAPTREADGLLLGGEYVPNAAPPKQANTSAPVSATPTSAHVGHQGLPSQAPLSAEELFQRALPSICFVQTESTSNDGGGLATAFAVGESGDVVTSRHVVADAIGASLTCGSSVGRVLDVAKAAPGVDIVQLRTNLRGVPPLPIVTDQARPGQFVAVIGNPRGLQFSISTGVVAAVRAARGVELVQFTAPASPGNSGGPVLDAFGRVIGVVSFRYGGPESQNLNFAVSTSELARLPDVVRARPGEVAASTGSEDIVNPPPQPVAAVESGTGAALEPVPLTFDGRGLGAACGSGGAVITKSLPGLGPFTEFIPNRAFVRNDSMTTYLRWSARASRVCSQARVLAGRYSFWIDPENDAADAEEIAEALTRQYGPATRKRFGRRLYGTGRGNPAVLRTVGYAQWEFRDGGRVTLVVDPSLDVHRPVASVSLWQEGTVKLTLPPVP